MKASHFVLGSVSLFAAACSGMDGAAVDELESEEVAIARAELATGVMHEGDILFEKQRLVAPNCYFRLVMGTDGNLIVYGGPGGGNPIWDTDTQPYGHYAYLQADNNFVVYGAGGSREWDTNTNGTLGTARLMMQDDGNLCIYSDRYLDALWCTHTDRPKQAWPCDQIAKSEVTRVQYDTDRPGGDLPGMPITANLFGHYVCGNACAKDPNCNAWTYENGSLGHPPKCWLKGSQPGGVARTGMTSGIKIRL